MPKQSILHNELVRRSKVILRNVHDLWDGNKFQDVLFTWAGEIVKDDRGIPINDVVGCDLPAEKSRHGKIMRDMVSRTMACGILRIRKEKNVVRAITETVHGTVSWTFPVELRGDTRVLGSPVVRKDEDYLGVLWRKTEKLGAKEAVQTASTPTPYPAP